MLKSKFRDKTHIHTRMHARTRAHETERGRERDRQTDNQGETQTEMDRNKIKAWGLYLPASQVGSLGTQVPLLVHVKTLQPLSQKSEELQLKTAMFPKVVPLAVSTKPSVGADKDPQSEYRRIIPVKLNLPNQAPRLKKKFHAQLR